LQQGLCLDLGKVTSSIIDLSLDVMEAANACGKSLEHFSASWL